MTTPTTPTVTVPVTTYAAMKAQATGAGNSVAGNPFYLPTTTETGYLTQTSPQDIEAQVNAAMQQLAGRNATAQEIQQYGQELLAAERANQGNYKGTTTYAISGKRNTVTGEQTTTGIDPQGFLAQIISGSADAQSYKAATGYFDGMTQALQQMKSI